MTQLWRTTLEVLDSDGIPVQQRAFLSLAKLVGLLDDTALIAVPERLHQGHRRDPAA